MQRPVSRDLPGGHPDPGAHARGARSVDPGLSSAGRYLAGRKFLGWGKPDAFDEHYDERLMASGLTPFQRSYAYVLAHGLDAVNADMQAFGHLEESRVPDGTTLLCSYHPSRQNTNTGRLTRTMWHAVFRRARALLDRA